MNRRDVEESKSNRWDYAINRPILVVSNSLISKLEELSFGDRTHQESSKKTWYSSQESVKIILKSRSVTSGASRGPVENDRQNKSGVNEEQHDSKVLHEVSTIFVRNFMHLDNFAFDGVSIKKVP